MANSYFYSNTAVQTTLSGNISAGATSISVGSVTGFPVQYPYILAFDYGATTEELVSVTAAAGTTLTVTRAFGGTSGQSHSIGAVVRHVYNAQDATDFRTHEASTGAVHGLTGSIVGTSDTQTLSGKTLTSPTINAGAFSGTFTGTPTFSGAPSLTAGAAVSGGSVTISRASATNPAVNLQVTGDSNARLLQQADGKLIWGPGNAVGDAVLYRDGANVLGTTDTLLRAYRTAAGSPILSGIQTGDANARWYTEAGGKHWWGNGTAAVDANFYRSGVGVLATDTSLSVGGNLSVVGIGGQLHARKTGDTTVTNSVAITQDPHLVVTVPANSIWEMVGCLFYASGVITGDLNYQFTGPASSAGFHTAVGPSTVVNTDPPNEAVGASQSGNRTIATAIGSGRSYGVPNTGNVFGLEVKGMFEIAGTAGTISVDWAQQTAQTTGTTLKIYSWFSLTRVA